MKRRIVAVTAALSLLSTNMPLPAAAQAATDAELQRGIQQAREGNFDAAVITLDGVARQLASQPGRAKQLAQAYTYLAVAYLGLSQEQAAKAKFLEALKADGNLDVSTREFPPRIVQFFEQARKETQPAPAAPPTPAPAASAPAKKGGSKLPLILLGVAAAGGAAVAAGGGGGGGGNGGGGVTVTTLATTTTTSTTTTSTTTTLADRGRQEIRRFDLASNSRTSYTFTIGEGVVSATLSFTPTGGGDMVFFVSRDGTNAVSGGYAQGNSGSLRVDPGTLRADQYIVVVHNGSLTQRTGEMRFNFQAP
jgi:hypothetical protein